MENTTTSDLTTVASLVNSTVNPITTVDIALTFVSSSLSIFGAIIVFTAFCAVNPFRPENETRRLLLYLTFSDWLVALGIFIGTVRYLREYRDGIHITCPESCNVCVVQSFVTTVANMWSYFWNTTIAIHLFIALVYCRHGTHPWTIKIFTHTICWFVPLGITIAAFSKDVLGEDFSQGTGAWCWVSSCKPKDVRTIWMLVSGKAWEVIWYLATCVMFLWLKGYMWKQKRKHNRRSFQEVSQRLKAEDENYLYLWLIGYICRIWGTIRFFLYVYNRSAETPLENLTVFNKWLLHLQSFGGSAQAFCTCLLFCVKDETTRKHIWSKLKCKRSEEIKNEEFSSLIGDDTPVKVNYTI